MIHVARRAAATLTAGTLVCLIMTACQADPDPRLGYQMMPADFALEFNIIAPDDSDDPLRQPGQYVLEPNRNLRVALGRGATDDLFPSITRTIPLEQQIRIWERVDKNQLLSEPTSATGEQRPDHVVLYNVTVRAWGRVNSFVTTPEESPPAAQVLADLTRLRGATIDPDSIPKLRTDPMRDDQDAQEPATNDEATEAAE